MKKCNANENVVQLDHGGNSVHEKIHFHHYTVDCVRPKRSLAKVRDSKPPDSSKNQFTVKGWRKMFKTSSIDFILKPLLNLQVFLLILKGGALCFGIEMSLHIVLFPVYCLFGLGILFWILFGVIIKVLSSLIESLQWKLSAQIQHRACWKT